MSVGPCPQDPECAPTPTTQLLYDIRADGTVEPFLRHMVVDCEGNVLETNDTALDGQDYTVDPNGQVVAQAPLPMADCTPSPDETSVAVGCGAGEQVDIAVLETRGANRDARVEQDANGDQACSGRWTTSPAPQAAGFPINESFRYAGFDTGDANWALQGVAVLTAGNSNNPDPAGEGRLQLSNLNAFSNGAAIYIPVFSNADNITTEVSWASYGTSRAGDGWMQFFSDGSQPPQDNALGGGGNLGLFNIDYPFLAVVLDEYGGSGGQGGSHSGNSLRIKACFDPGGPTPPQNSYRDIHTVPLPNPIGNRPRGDEPRLRTSIVTENGETFISAAIDWNDGNGFVPYISRFNVTAECGGLIAPATLRTGFSASSGGAFQSRHELSDLTIQQAGVQAWRALQITADSLPACATQAKVRACVNATITQTDAAATNASPELFFWLVNAATQTVISAAEASAVPPDGIPRTLCVQETVNAADLPDLRLYVGADRRDEAGGYGTEWHGLDVKVTALCPAEPQKTVAISAPCPIPVDPGCAPTPTTQLLYDMLPNGTALPFLRHMTVDCDGAVLSVSETTLDGQPYEPAGEVKEKANSYDLEKEVMCDGTETFLRWYVTRDGQPTDQFFDTKLDGAHYEAAGPVSAGECESCAPTPTTQLLYDIRADGTVVPFRRDTVVDCEGNILSSKDTTLDGQDYIVDPNGEVVVQPPAEEPCASTVHAREMRDLRPDVEPNEEGQRCAVLFFRNYVYDCEGNFVRHYDTDAEGQEYKPVAVADCPDGLIPSLVELEWPQTDVIRDPDGEEGHDFIYIVTNPRTGDEARIKFNTFNNIADSCGSNWEPGQDVSANAPPGNPSSDSRFTFKLDEAARRMTSLRLDFVDLDTFEGVRELDPVPDHVEFIEGAGTWEPGSNRINATVDNSRARAYYNNPPETITHLYRNMGGGIACHAAAFRGLTYASGPCCSCGECSGGGGSDCVTSTTQVLCDVRTDEAYSFDFTTIADWPRDDCEEPPCAYSGTAPNGVGWSVTEIVQGFTPGPDGATYACVFGDQVEWTFDRPVDMKFGTGDIVYSSESCLTLPSEVESVQINPEYGWDSSTKQLCHEVQGNPNHIHNEFRLTNTRSLILTATDTGGAASPSWGMSYLTITPAATAPEQFLRHITIDCDGKVLSVKNMKLDGSDYDVKGQAQLCD
ncbi:hypothetical protein [Chelativorans salis]|uniref:TNFR-Cys domain-containing protein n=1 Tax=Chelativorans salis TaxID=2978478 RepID=A0ABT2LND5_9HYPH|nr:hypothetical protein [Chelativorans sp. EGI FJ00035]MCT7376076.1 hypothetical protein [Chelativorans sp. EGI FJ00035]